MPYFDTTGWTPADWQQHRDAMDRQMAEVFAQEQAAQAEPQSSTSALEWISALAQLGGIVSQALAARKRKRQRGETVVIPGEAQPTRIDVPQEDISQFLPGSGRAG